MILWYCLFYLIFNVHIGSKHIFSFLAHLGSALYILVFHRDCLKYLALLQMFPQHTSKELGCLYQALSTPSKVPLKGLSSQSSKSRSHKRKDWGLPWRRSGWECACQCRGHGFEPWSGKIPHAAEQLGAWATTTEPAHLEPVLCNKGARQWEARAPRWRVAPARRNWRKPSHRNEDPTQPKINK